MEKKKIKTMILGSYQGIELGTSRKVTSKW